MSVSDGLDKPIAADGYGALSRFRTGPLGPFIADGDVLEVDGSAPGAPVAADESQETVFAGYRLQDIADYRGALQSWFRAVRVGGHLIVAVPHAFLYERQLALPSRWQPAQRRLYTPRALIEEIEEALAPNSYRVRWLGDDDTDYDYGLGVDMPPTGAHDVLLAIQRIAPPAWRPAAVSAAKAPAPDFAFEPGRTRIEAAAPRPCDKILILKLDHLGDFIMGLPALERARAAFAGAEITLVVGSWNVAMAQEMGIADHILPFDVFPRNSSEEVVDVVGKTALFQAMITEDYDLAIDLRSDPDTRFLLRSVRAGIRAGIGTRAQFPYLDIFLPIDGTRNEPETARIDEFNHHSFASHPDVVRGEFRMFGAAKYAQAESAMVWGPYYRLRPGRYMFEPYIEFGDKGAGLLSLDVALDQQWVVHKTVPADGRVQLPFVVEKAQSLFEFRIWALRDSPAIDFHFYGGRLIREGAASVLHQSEYLSLLIELVQMRVSRFGLLGDSGAGPA